MDKRLLILIVVIGAVAAFIGYFAVLVDWLQDYTNGTYDRIPTEAILETGALTVYTFLGIRFFNRHLSSLR